jgi:hypothetical protein
MTYAIVALCVRTLVATASLMVRPDAGVAEDQVPPATMQAPLIPSPPPPGPTGAHTDEEVRASERWALLGAAIPAGAGAAFSIVTEPGGKVNVPTWQVATLSGLFGFAGLWGVSMGYYRAHRPLYATLTGVAKTALLASAIAVDRRNACERCDVPPILTLATIVGIVVWGVWEYHKLESSVRERATGVAYVPAAPISW